MGSDYKKGGGRRARNRGGGPPPQEGGNQGTRPEPRHSPTPPGRGGPAQRGEGPNPHPEATRPPAAELQATVAHCPRHSLFPRCHLTRSSTRGVTAPILAFQPHASPSKAMCQNWFASGCQHLHRLTHLLPSMNVGTTTQWLLLQHSSLLGSRRPHASPRNTLCRWRGLWRICVSPHCICSPSLVPSSTSLC